MKKNCSKNILLISLCILFFILAGAGVYFLLKERNEKTLTVDKYQETTNWCDIQTSGDQFLVSCKALLLNITMQEDQSSCFDIQIISKDDELKDFEICGPSSVLTYENDILEYKKLKPIDIQMQYRWSNNVESYTLQTIYVSPVEEEYINDIVSEDINSLINTTFDTELSELTAESGITKLSVTNPDTYVIKNSVDFCPEADALRKYLTDTTTYSDFYYSYTQAETQYANLYYDDSFLEIIPNLFACKSADSLGYSVCGNEADTLISTESLNGTNIAWGNEMKLMDNVYLKKVSMLYDSLVQGKTNPTDDLDTIIAQINYTETVNETTVCAMYNIYDAISHEEGKNIITTLVLNNLDKVTSSSCLSILPADIVDVYGRYIKGYLNNKNNENVLRIYNDCTNLSNLVNE